MGSLDIEHSDQTCIGIRGIWIHHFIGEEKLINLRGIDIIYHVTISLDKGIALQLLERTRDGGCSMFTALKFVFPLHGRQCSRTFQRCDG